MTKSDQTESFTLSWKTLALTLIALDVGIAVGFAAKSVAGSRREPVAVSEEAVSELDATAASAMPCGEEKVAADYVTADRVTQLREGALKDPNSIFSLKLTPGEKSVVTGAFSSDPGGAFYTARIARSYSIAEGLDEQVKCLGAGGSVCAVPPSVQHFAKNPYTGADMKPEEWTQKRDEWIDFLKQDIKAGSHCLGS
jgi:hypothetical protein